MTIDHCMGWATDKVSPPLQARDELVEFLKLIKAENVKSYLEIGSRYGGTFEAVMTRCPPGSFGVCVDFPGGEFGDDNSAPLLLAALKRIRRNAREASVIFGPSGAPEVVDRAVQHAPYDCVFIDGDHAYEAVKRDFELYAPMGRMIALHDIAAPDDWTDGRGSLVEVGRFWREIRHLYRSFEIVTPGTNMGIGVLWR